MSGPSHTVSLARDALEATHRAINDQETEKNRNADMSKRSSSEYQPEWRKWCDAWMDKRLEVRENARIPVHTLYNTYITENPNNYMDIAQVKREEARRCSILW